METTLKTMGRAMPNRWAAASGGGSNAFAQMESCTSFGLSSDIYLEDAEPVLTNTATTIPPTKNLSNWLGKLPLKAPTLGSGASLFLGGHNNANKSPTVNKKASSASVAPRPQRRSSLGATALSTVVEFRKSMTATPATTQQQQQQNPASPRRRHSLFGNLGTATAAANNKNKTPIEDTTDHSDISDEIIKFCMDGQTNTSKSKKESKNESKRRDKSSAEKKETIGEKEGESSSAEKKKSKKKKSKSSSGKSKKSKTGEEKKSKSKSKSSSKDNADAPSSETAADSTATSLKQLSQDNEPAATVRLPARTLLAAPSMMNVTTEPHAKSSALPSRALLAAPSMMNVAQVTSPPPRMLLAAPSMMNVGATSATKCSVKDTAETEHGVTEENVQLEEADKPEESRNDVSENMVETVAPASDDTSDTKEEAGAPATDNNGVDMEQPETAAPSKPKTRSKRKGRYVSRRASTGAKTMTRMVDAAAVAAANDAVAATVASATTSESPRRRKGVSRRSSTGTVGMSMVASSALIGAAAAQAPATLSRRKSRDMKILPDVAATETDRQTNECAVPAVATPRRRKSGEMKIVQDAATETDMDEDEDDEVMPMKEGFAASVPDPRLAWMRSPSGLSNHLELKF